MKSRERDIEGKVAKLWESIGTLAGAGSAVVALFAVLTLKPEARIDEPTKATLTQQAIAVAAARAEAQQARTGVTQLRLQLDQMTKLSPDGALSARLKIVEDRSDTLSARLEFLEKTILTTPEKALALPMMRKDLDAQRDANAQAFLAMKANVDQLYDLTKWLLGTMAVSVLGLVFSTYLRMHNSRPAESTAG